MVTPDSFQVLERMDSERPKWGDSLRIKLGGWKVLQNGSAATLERLSDLNQPTEIVWLAYSTTSEAMSRTGKLIESVGLHHEDLLDAIDLPAACGELTRHLFLKQWLEAGKDPTAF